MTNPFRLIDQDTAIKDVLLDIGGPEIPAIVRMDDEVSMRRIETFLGIDFNWAFSTLESKIQDIGQGPTIMISSSSQPENTAIGTAIGTLSVVAGSGSYTFTKTVDTDNAFTLTGSTLKNAISFNYETATHHSVTISADNGVDTPITKVLSILVTNVNEAPVITSNGGGTTASITINENTTAVTTVTATDVDAGTTLTYSISGGADAGKFQIDSSSGILSFIDAPDFENPTDANTDNAYVVAVQVSDGALTDTQTITVTVADVVSEDVNAALMADFSDANNEAWMFQ